MTIKRPTPYQPPRRSKRRRLRLPVLAAVLAAFALALAATLEAPPSERFVARSGERVTEGGSDGLRSEDLAQRAAADRTIADARAAIAGAEAAWRAAPRGADTIEDLRAAKADLDVLRSRLKDAETAHLAGDHAMAERSARHLGGMAAATAERIEQSMAHLQPDAR
ncbi:MAG: hypothetical protein AAGN46_02270 [Acidobacteriota bacterium]